VNPYERLVRAIGRTRAFPIFGRHVLTPIDRRLHGKSRTLTTLGTSFPLCYLTTIGRRSGEPRTTPLLVVTGVAGWMIAATNFGGAPPAWSLNLRAEPKATLELNGSRHRVSAQLANAEEAAAGWPQFEAAWPGFADYRRRADRPIDVFVLTRIE